MRRVRTDQDYGKNNYDRTNLNSMPTCSKDEWSQIIGQRLTWDSKRILRCDCDLFFNGRMVASLKSKWAASSLFEGTYDDIPVRLNYHHLNPPDTTIIHNEQSKEQIGTIDGMMESLHSMFKLGKREFHLDYLKDIGYVLSNAEGTHIAKNEFDRTVTPVVSAFTLLRMEESYPNPWLIALILHYYTLQHGLGWA